jgi:hypothetical protein
MFCADKMTVSGLQRYVRIVDAVLNSASYLSCEDRINLIHEILDSTTNPRKDEIEVLCKASEDVNMEHNLALSSWRRAGNL